MLKYPFTPQIQLPRPGHVSVFMRFAFTAFIRSVKFSWGVETETTAPPCIAYRPQRELLLLLVSFRMTARFSRTFLIVILRPCCEIARGRLVASLWTFHLHIIDPVVLTGMFKVFAIGLHSFSHSCVDPSHSPWLPCTNISDQWPRLIGCNFPENILFIFFWAIFHATFTSEYRPLSFFFNAYKFVWSQK